MADTIIEADVLRIQKETVASVASTVKPLQMGLAVGTANPTATLVAKTAGGASRYIKSSTVFPDVADTTAMIALSTALHGDVAVLADGSTYMLNSDSPAVLADWIAIGSSGGGSVALPAGEVGYGNATSDGITSSDKITVDAGVLTLVESLDAQGGINIGNGALSARNEILGVDDNGRVFPSSRFLDSDYSIDIPMASGQDTHYKIGGLDHGHAPESTGVVSFAGLSIGSPTSKFSVGIIKAYFIDNTYPNNPSVRYFEFTAQANLTVSNIATQNITFIAVDSSGTIHQSATPFTPSECRSWIPLGALIHTNRTAVTGINNAPISAFGAVSQFADLCGALGQFNMSGNIISANGANLAINKSLGEIFKIGSNFVTDSTDPNTLNLSALTAPTSLRYHLRDGTETTVGTGGVIDSSHYDNAGSLDTVATNKWTIQRVYVFQTNLIRIQYGQTLYNSRAEAVAGITSEIYATDAGLRANGILRCYLVSRGGASALNSLTDAQFIEAGKFGEAGGASGVSTTTLQGAYNNSSEPEILIDSIHNDLIIQNGRNGSDSSSVFTVKNYGGDTKFEIQANGLIRTYDSSSSNSLAITSTGNSANFTLSTGPQVNIYYDGSLNIPTGTTYKVNGVQHTHTLPNILTTTSGTIPYSNGTNLAETSNLTYDTTNGLTVESNSQEAAHFRYSAWNVGQQAKVCFELQDLNVPTDRTCYAECGAEIIDNTNTSEDGAFVINAITAGALTEQARFVNGNFGVGNFTPADNPTLGIHLRKASATDVASQVENTTSGTAAYAYSSVKSSTVSMNRLVFSPLYTSADCNFASGGTIRQSGAGGLSLVAAGGAVRIYTNGGTTADLAVTFGTDKSATFAGKIVATSTSTRAGVNLGAVFNIATGNADAGDIWLPDNNLLRYKSGGGALYDCAVLSLAQTFQGFCTFSSTGIRLSGTGSATTAGDLCHNTTQKQYVGYIGSAPAYMASTVFTSYATTTAVTSVTETTLLSATKLGGLTLGTPVAGQRYRVHAAGVYSASANNAETFRLKMSNSTIFTLTTASAITASSAWVLEINLTWISTTACNVTGKVTFVATAGTPVEYIVSTLTTGVTAASAAMDLTAQHATVTTSSIQCYESMIQKLS